MTVFARMKVAAVATLLGAWSLAAGQNLTLKRQSATPLAPGEGPRLELSPRNLRFGEVWQGEPVRQEFQIKNVGTAPLTLEAKSSCGCTLVTKPKSPLEPGESSALTISYDTLKRSGTAKQSVTLTTNDPDQFKVAIAVEGEVKPLVVLDPPSGISFDSLRADARATRVVKLKSKYDGPLHLKLRPGQNLKPFEIALKEVEPGAEFELTVQTVPPLAERVSAVDVVLETGLEKSPEIHLTARAYVQSDVMCSRSVLRVSRQTIAPKEETIELRYRSDRPVKITQVRPSTDTIKYEILPPQPASGDWTIQKIRVTLPPGGELPAGDARLEILTDSAEPQFQKFEVQIQVVGGPESGGGGVGPTTRPQGAGEPGQPAAGKKP